MDLLGVIHAYCGEAIFHRFSMSGIGYAMDALTFKTSSVQISNSPCDNYQGNYPLLTDNGNYEVIIVGSGMSGCSAAYYITRNRPGTKILILDGQAAPGGNANRDDLSPIPDIASTATAYAVQPYAPFLTDIYTTTIRRPGSIGRITWCRPRSTVTSLIVRHHM